MNREFVGKILILLGLLGISAYFVVGAFYFSGAEVGWFILAFVTLLWVVAGGILIYLLPI